MQPYCQALSMLKEFFFYAVAKMISQYFKSTFSIDIAFKPPPAAQTAWEKGRFLF